MRIVMLAQFYPPDIGGEERHAHNLALGLQRAGHEVMVVTSLLPGTPEGAVEEDGVVVRRVRTSAQRLGRFHSDPARPHALPIADPAMRQAIADAVRDHRAELVHAHNWIVNSAIGLRGLPVPVVLTLHDYSHVCATKRLMRRDAVPCPGPGPVACVRCAAHHYGPVGPAVAAANALERRRRERRLSAIVPVSRAVERDNRLSGRALDVEVIPNFVPDELLAEVPFDASAPLLFLGDRTRDKGTEVLLTAYGLLASPPPLRLVGRSIPGVAESLPPGAAAFPPQPHDAVMEVLRASSIVVVPSIVGDACPTVVLEAMAAGRPVIGSATGGIVDLVVDRETGLLVRPGDPVALAGAIGSLLLDPLLAERLGAEGRRRAEGFTCSAVVSRLEAVYERALSQSPARSATRTRSFPRIVDVR